jgi:hypothetical protein
MHVIEAVTDQSRRERRATQAKLDEMKRLTPTNKGGAGNLIRRVPYFAPFRF